MSYVITFKGNKLIDVLLTQLLEVNNVIIRHHFMSLHKLPNLGHTKIERIRKLKTESRNKYLKPIKCTQYGYVIN